MASFACLSAWKDGQARRGVIAGSLTGHPVDDHTTNWWSGRVLLIAWDAVGWAVALAVASSLRASFSMRDIERRPFLTAVAVTVFAQLAVHALCGPTRQTSDRRHRRGDHRRDRHGVGRSGRVRRRLLVHRAFVPRSVPLLAAPIAVLIAVGSRLAVRLYRERHYRADYSLAHRVIVLGAGIDGQHLRDRCSRIPRATTCRSRSWTTTSSCAATGFPVLLCGAPGPTSSTRRPSRRPTCSSSPTGRCPSLLSRRSRAQPVRPGSLW